MVRSSSLQRTASALASINFMPRMRSMGWSQVAGARNFMGSSIARMPARFPEGMPAFKDLKDEGMWVEPSNSGGGKNRSAALLPHLHLCAGDQAVMSQREETRDKFVGAVAPNALSILWHLPASYWGENTSWIQSALACILLHSHARIEQIDGAPPSGPAVDSSCASGMHLSLLASLSDARG